MSTHCPSRQCRFRILEASALPERQVPRLTAMDWPAMLFRSFPQTLQHTFRDIDLRQLREYFLHAMAVRVGITVGHRVGDQHDVVAMIVSAARCRFHAGAR